jgi:hypothetical protein
VLLTELDALGVDELKPLGPNTGAYSAICDGSGMNDSVSRLTSPHYSHA